MDLHLDTRQINNLRTGVKLAAELKSDNPGLRNLDDIKGIEALEIELRNYVQDFSVLQPEWHCDNPL